MPANTNRKSRISYVIKDFQDSPLHRQGINCLLVDPAEGILYSGGRDSIINSWNLNLHNIINQDDNNTRSVPPNLAKLQKSSSSSLPLNYKADKRSYSKSGRVSFDQDAGRAHVNKLHHSSLSLIGYQQQIEYNLQMLEITPSTTHRNSYQWHGDWVNDLALYKDQYLISCSSDRTVCCWDLKNNSRKPDRLGFHGDYVKRLALPAKLDWIASGGLDRQVILWDLKEPRPQEGRVIFSEEDPSASIYALATNPSGNIIACGTPQKFVRLLDPRAKNSNVQKLLGHSDSIRDLLVSDDGRWVLSASSDTTIKLWSLAMANHCVTTFNQSESSIWCLATNSPTLDTFWAGAKDGWVYKISCSQTDEEFRDSDCIAVAKEKDPVLKIVGIEDSYVWTSTTSPSINRYKDVSFVPSSDLIIPDSCFCRRDVIDEDESLYSRPVSIVSGSDHAKVVSGSPGHMSNNSESDLLPLWPHPNETISGLPGIRKAFLLNNKRYVVTLDTVNNVCVWDIISCTKISNLGAVDFDNACEAENTQEWVANWCTIDTKHGDLTVHLDEGKCHDSEVYFQDLNPLKEPRNEDQRVNLAKWALTMLFFEYLKKIYPDNPSFKKQASSGDIHGIEARPSLPISRNDSNKIETPSMNVYLATPLSASVKTPAASVQDNTEQPPSSGTALVMDPPYDNGGSDGKDSADSKGEKVVKSPGGSFMGKFKFKLRNSGSKADDVSPSASVIVPTKPTEKQQPEDPVPVINDEETPPIYLDPSINIIISVEDSNSMFVDVYRERTGDLGKGNFSEILPSWLNEWIILSNPPVKDLAKLSFVLAKHPKSSLPEIPLETNRLTANRMLRIRKVIQYLAEKINITIHPSCIGSSSKIEDKGKFIELYCNGKA